MSLTAAESAAVVGELRRARRQQRVAAIHWVDALYQVYITGLVAIVAVVLASGAVGDAKLDAAGVLDVRQHGPAVLGTLFAVAVLFGLRSGSRGGPLALERPDVRHVLLAPVDRGVALRGPAWRQLRFLVAIGAAVGATAGQLAVRRLPGNPVAWMACGALLAVAVVLVAFGCALVASGLGLRPWLASLIGGVLVAWAVADVVGSAPTAPTTHLGSLGLWPLEFDALGLLGPVLGILLVVLGMRGVAGMSLEAAERRTQLVGQLRFAVTLQDLRTVLVLRRQLAQENARSRPWIRARARSPRFPVWQRCLRSTARWPLSRVIRVVLLAVIAGLALRGAWSGTTPLVIVAGIALWVAGLDAVEPMGQEVDHPGRTDAFPLDRGELLLRYLPATGAVSVAVGLLAAVVMAAPIGTHLPWDLALLLAVSGGLLAGAGAAVSVVQGAPEVVDSLAVMTPEIAGTRTVLRTAMPPAFAIAGTLPLLAARAAERGVSEPPPLQAALTACLPLVFLLTLIAGWVRFRDDIARWIKEASEQMSPTAAAERASAEREAEEAREAEALAESRRLAGLDEVDPDGDEDDESPRAPAKAAPRPKPKPKPKPSEPAPGTPVQGGSSAKPIGRKRDQK